MYDVMWADGSVLSFASADVRVRFRRRQRVDASGFRLE